MSLIFHQLTESQARAFAAEVRQKYGLTGDVCARQDDSDKIDPFPQRLDPFIVLIDRPDIENPNALKIEQAIEDLVIDFGGEFAGT